MNQDFIQTIEPYCSAINIGVLEQTRCEINATFYDVPIKKLGEIRDR